MMVWLLIAPAWFFTALLEWWAGRVLLPEMGLRAPGYWTWFWFDLVALVAGFGRGLVKWAVKEWG